MLAEVVYPALRQVFERLVAGSSEYAWVTPEGFLGNGGAPALTWMDARGESGPVTPRKGLAVELQALWSRACETLASLAREMDDAQVEQAAVAARDKVRAEFKNRFWCHQTGYPFDCVSDARHAGEAWADPSIRPNALIALAVDPELFEPWQRQALLERCERDLLTPRGIRSLAPTETDYIGHVGGTVAEREASYHQGPVWPYLLGFYVRASLSGPLPPTPGLTTTPNSPLTKVAVLDVRSTLMRALPSAFITRSTASARCAWSWRPGRAPGSTGSVVPAGATGPATGPVEVGATGPDGGVDELIGANARGGMSCMWSPSWM